MLLLYMGTLLITLCELIYVFFPMASKGRCSYHHHTYFIVNFKLPQATKLELDKKSGSDISAYNHCTRLSLCFLVAPTH